MFNMVLFAILIAICTTLRYKYDKKYVVPVINENADLQSIKKWAIILLAIAIGCYFAGQPRLTFIILLLLIPFVLYMNIKSNWIGFRNYKNDRK